MTKNGAAATSGGFDTAALDGDAPSAEACLAAARELTVQGRAADAARWAARVADHEDGFAAWQAAAQLLARLPGEARAEASRRHARVAVLGTYTTMQLAPMIALAAFRRGIDVALYEGGYDQLRQEILAPESGLYAFEPDVVVLAPHAGALGLPPLSADPDADADAEVDRWTGLWAQLRERSGARIVQHLFALPPDDPFGHLASRLPGSWHRTVTEINRRLADAAGDGVAVVDCERLAGLVGKRRWFDDRYWYLARQAVGLGALPMLARHTAAVVAAELGLARKCLVADLDGTLWGGVVGEDGVAGIALGGDARGEAYAAFQEYLRALKERGVVLAVCSKNNPDDARAPFAEHPDMRLSLDDFAAFVANWEPKPGNVRRIADELGLGLDALVYVDDNPAEREAVRRALPEVEVVPLGTEPAGYRRAVAETLLFEASAYTEEDARRTASYRARGAAREAEAAGDLQEFLRSLEMVATLAPFDDLDLPRIVQLIGKTNQWNLTTRRHARPAVEAFRDDPDVVDLSLRLRDRFGDHGLVAVLVAGRSGDALEIDTWLMSCRVIGRTVETTMLAALCERAEALGCRRLLGTFVPSGRNEPARDVFAGHGFALLSESDGVTTWQYDLRDAGPIENPLIAVEAA